MRSCWPAWRAPARLAGVMVLLASCHPTLALAALWPRFFGVGPPSGPAIPATLSVHEGISLIRNESLESLSFDIGGSLIKVLVFQKGQTQDDKPDPPWDGKQDYRRHPRLTLYVPQLGGTLTFLTCETREIADCLDLARLYSAEQRERRLRSGKVDRSVIVRATGGGSFQYARAFADAGVLLDRRDELACLVGGVSFLLRYCDGEAFTVESSLGPARAKPSDGMQTFQKHFLPADPGARYPYLLVNIGSGVSILEVRSRKDFRRVSGSSLGGSTFFSLCQLLTEYQSFQDILDGSQIGDLSRVDMLVGDLYPGSDAPLGLKSDLIASSLGKVPQLRVKQAPWRVLLGNLVRAVWGTLWLWMNFLLTLPVVGGLLKRLGLARWTNATYLLRPWASFGPQDVTLSLLRAIINNVGQLSFLNAKNCGIKRVVFTGNFLRNDPYIMATVNHALQFWSQGEMEAIFLTHQGFAGCLGAYLCNTPYKLGLKGSIFQAETKSDRLTLNVVRGTLSDQKLQN